MNHNFDNIRHRSIGTVEFVSPKEIKVLLETDAPLSTSLNTGVPQLFPRINGILLIPNEAGALIGIITWIGIEYSPYPKRKGYKDFDLVDLPFPLRKLSLSPLGILKEKNEAYEIERGVYNYPSVGDIVIVPSQEQLKAIVQNKDENAQIKIGVSPMAANAPIFVDPDKLFGRHLAILGNTGSGKSCSVAGLIRWSIEIAKKKNKKNNGQQTCDSSDNNIDKTNVNARFIIFDPNGEYGTCFEGLGKIKRYEVKIREGGNSKQLKVPSWMWNSWEWASIAQASARTQRPLLRRALREVRNADIAIDENRNKNFRNFLVSLKISLLNYQREGARLSEWPGKQNYGEFLENIKKSLNTFDTLEGEEYSNIKQKLLDSINQILDTRQKKDRGYYLAFSLDEVNPLLDILTNSEQTIGQMSPYEGPCVLRFNWTPNTI
jgi:hypothetical protein